MSRRARSFSSSWVMEYSIYTVAASSDFAADKHVALTTCKAHYFASICVVGGRLHQL